MLGSACTAGSSTSPSSAGNGATAGSRSLNVGLVLEPASLDFTRIDGAAIPQALLSNVYETLVQHDQSGKIVPDRATSWEVSDDKKTYTFDLVPNANFSNGDPFTADTAVFSINNVKSNNWTISLKSAMDVVVDARALSPTQLQRLGTGSDRGQDVSAPSLGDAGGDTYSWPASAGEHHK
jgi:peptide/nickel transport system substrate-binding protein